MEVIVKKYQELELDELYGILALRQEVFIVEQDCPYQDADNLDQYCEHVFILDGKDIAAYARIVPPGHSYKKYSSIGRVISKQKYRGKSYAKSVMIKSIERCQYLFSPSNIKISAQCYAEGYYTSLGFKSTGETYLEDGIPHVSMIYSNTK